MQEQVESQEVQKEEVIADAFDLSVHDDEIYGEARVGVGPVGL